MAELYSSFPTSHFYTSKSRPLSSINNQLTPHPVQSPHAQPTKPSTPVAGSLKRRHEEDSDDEMDTQSQSAAQEKKERVLAPARTRKGGTTWKKPRPEPKQGKSGDNNKNNEDEIDAGVLLG